MTTYHIPQTTEKAFSDKLESEIMRKTAKYNQLCSYQKQVTCESTSKVTNEVVKLHLAFGFDVGIVQVSVEHNDRECNQENSVRRFKPRHFVHIAVAVATSKRLQVNRFILLNVT